MKRELVDLQAKAKLGKQMYEEVKIQRETIRDLESKLVMSAPHSSFHQSKQSLQSQESRNSSAINRERCVSVQRMEGRSQSPLIPVPKLDLSKVKPYDKPKKPEDKHL
jgi:exonuclease VII large subunit